MPKINDTKKYQEKTTLTGNEILLASDQGDTGDTINVPISTVASFVSTLAGGFNGVVGVGDNPNGKTNGYWIANEKGVYPFFGGVENLWDTAVITLINGVFTIEEFLNTEKLQYDDDFLI